MTQATLDLTIGASEGLLTEFINRAREALVDRSLTPSERVRRAAEILNACAIPRKAGMRSGGRSPERKGGLAGWQVQRVRDFIEASLDKPVRLTDLATITRVSPSHFSRAFLVSFEETPHSYMVRRRLERSLGLMQDTRRSLCEVAMESGFSDQAHFNRVFKQRLGKSPGAWRRAHQPPLAAEVLLTGSAWSASRFLTEGVLR
jgi:AraC-like DNA-binding protein